MDIRTRAKLDFKLSDIQSTPWWQKNELVKSDGNVAPMDFSEAPEVAPVPPIAPPIAPEAVPVEGKADNVTSTLFSGGMETDSKISPDVQDNVVSLIQIIKDLSLSFYGLTLSDTEALKIAKENLKDISSRISHIPVEQLTDILDDRINKIDKGTTTNQSQNPETNDQNAKAQMPVDNPTEPPAAQEAAPEVAPAPAPEEANPLGKMASKSASTASRELVKSIWGAFIDILPKVPELKPVYDNLKEKYGDYPFLHASFLETFRNEINSPEIRGSGMARRFVQELESNKLPYRWLQVENEAEPTNEDEVGRPVENIGAFEPQPWDRKPSIMRDYYKDKKDQFGEDSWDDVKLASLYSEQKSSINRHFNVESLQQFVNVVKYNSDNFEYFLKNNSNESKKTTPW